MYGVQIREKLSTEGKLPENLDERPLKSAMELKGDWLS